MMTVIKVAVVLCQINVHLCRAQVYSWEAGIRVTYYPMRNVEVNRQCLALLLFTLPTYSFPLNSPTVSIHTNTLSFHRKCSVLCCMGSLLFYVIPYNLFPELSCGYFSFFSCNISFFAIKCSTPDLSSVNPKRFFLSFVSSICWMFSFSVVICLYSTNLLSVESSSVDLPLVWFAPQSLWPWWWGVSHGDGWTLLYSYRPESLLGFATSWGSFLVECKGSAPLGISKATTVSAFVSNILFLWPGM